MRLIRRVGRLHIGVNAMADYKMKGSDLYDRSSNKLGTLRGNDIYDNHSNKIGVIKGTEIYDNRSNMIAKLRGSDIYDASSNKIGTLEQAKKSIEGAVGGASVAAFWVLFVH
jgi:hypothetical protein